MLKTAHELMQELGAKCKAKRLEQNLTRAGLGARSGVSVSVIRQFEQTGKISLESLLKLAIALGAGGEFESLFAQSDPAKLVSMDELLKQPKKRQRGRLR